MATPKANKEIQESDASLRKVLEKFPEITLAMLFGSVAKGKATASSDLDVAVAARHPLSAEQKMALITALADHTGRPIDLIDLNSIGQPLLGQIVMNSGSGLALLHLLVDAENAILRSLGVGPFGSNTAFPGYWGPQVAACNRSAPAARLL